MHFHTAAYCILNHFNLSPSLETPKLQELKVLPSPLADICFLSTLCSPETLAAGQRNAELHSPRSSGWGPVAKSRTCSGGPVWAPRPSVAKHRDVSSVLPVPELLQPQHLLHSGSSWTLRQLSRASSCSHPGSGGVCSHTQPSCAKERPLPLGLQTPSFPLGQPFQPFQQPGFILPITSPGALQHLGGRDLSSGVVVSLLRPAAPGNAVLRMLSPSS